MSDLISREKAINAVYGMTRPTGIDELPYEYAEGAISDLPSADIMECARALKEHCNEHLRKPYSLCDDCPMFERVCRRFNVVPRWWDLPEGEKGGE